MIRETAKKYWPELNNHNLNVIEGFMRLAEKETYLDIGYQKLMRQVQHVDGLTITMPSLLHVSRVIGRKLNYGCITQFIPNGYRLNKPGVRKAADCLYGISKKTGNYQAVSKADLINLAGPHFRNYITLTELQHTAHLRLLENGYPAGIVYPYIMYAYTRRYTRDSVCQDCRLATPHNYLILFQGKNICPKCLNKDYRARMYPNGAKEYTHVS